MSSKMKLSEELRWRGFVNQTTLNNLFELDNKKWTFYHGYDASTDSLTIGNLAAVMLDKLFLRYGHRAILLAGGATSLIGDPGGKDTERPLQDEHTVEKNVRAVSSQLEKLLGPKVHMVNNLTWFRDMGVLDFLRDVGKHFSMTPLVQRDYIAKRMGPGGSGISYTEFSYTLLQGYDFLYLYRKYGVELQLAGSDQWGNCLSGIDLVRKVEGKQVHALTMPLIIDVSTGKKFGKSEIGAVWLDPNKTPPSDFYQFWINVSDESVEDYLKIFTELDKDKIDQIIADFKKDKPSRLAQKTLAWEVTKIVHGKEIADREKTRADNKQLGKIYMVSPTANTITTLVETGLATSKSEARRLLESGGIYINDQPFKEEDLSGVNFDNPVRMRRGKTLKNTVILKTK